ncbi:MAG: flagellar protein FliT [Burkholderiales bacterium]|nr:flagellar protein FliT [Burkholderiales bacterium]
MASAALELYEAIGAASRRMLEAARAGDWDALVEAEARCAALVAEARAAAPAPLGADEQQRKAEILRRVLADDAEIRRHLQPRLAALEAMLLGARNAERAQRLYEG